MRVKCIANKVSNLPEDCYSPVNHKDGEYDLIVGKSYVVYGIMFYHKSLWYFLDHKSYYPYHYPAFFFEIESNKISRYWKYIFRSEKTLEESYGIFSFPEWVNDDYFYDSLTDGNEKEKAIFRHYKKLMDLEFSDPAIQKKAINAEEDNWIICPDCDESWQYHSLDGMVECPKCKTVMHNPLYKEICIL